MHTNEWKIIVPATILNVLDFQSSVRLRGVRYREMPFNINLYQCVILSVSDPF